MRNFHLHLYGYPSPLPQLGPPLTGPDGELSTLRCDNLASGSFSVSFEETVAVLSAWPRMFVEMDGSFLWTGVAADLQAWQIDGMLYDHSGRIQRVELQGACPQAPLRQLLSAFAWPNAPLVAHLVDRQCFVDLADWFAFHYERAHR